MGLPLAEPNGKPAGKSALEITMVGPLRLRESQETGRDMRANRQMPGRADEKTEEIKTESKEMDLNIGPR